MGNASNLYVALLHYPVINRQGETIASAVTNLDLHDIARSARTYGVQAFYVVTPLTDQIDLAQKIVSHWTEGVGGEHNPKRRDALSLVRVKETLSDVLAHIGEKGDGPPETVVTSAKNRPGSLNYPRFREMIQTNQPYLLVLGTGWGLADTMMETADHLLAPVNGPGNYNHLSVRAAAAIILDRLLGTGKND